MLRSRFLPFLGLLFVMIAGTLSIADAANALRIRRITPAGTDVPAGRQIVLQFDRPVVPVGRMERTPDEIPITIEPALQCAWRWLTTTTLACQLTADTSMAPATRYTMTIRPGITTQDGTTLGQSLTHTFITKRPKISNTWFRTWKAPGMPHIQVIFDQPVTQSSVMQHLHMQTEDGARVALRAEPAKHYGARGWVVHPVEELPEDMSVALRVEPGIVSTAGPEPGIEQRAAVTFDTFPPFRFLGIRCHNNDGDIITVVPYEYAPTRKRCNPLRTTALLFSAPVITGAVKDVLHVTPDLAGGRTDYDPWADARTYSRLSRPHKSGRRYRLRLPAGLKAYTTYHLQAEGQRLQDEFGRGLPDDIDLQFATDHRPPNYHLKHTQSVLEQGVDTHLPLVITNIEDIELDYTTLTTQGRRANQHHTITPDKAEDIAYAIPLKVRELLPAPSGVLQGSIRTTPTVGKGKPRWFFSQVTPFHVHVKLGHYTTLVWVTRFADGQPVSEAQVSIYIEPLSALTAHPSLLSEGQTNAEGIAQLAGTSTLDPQLEVLNDWRRKRVLFVRVRYGEDMALVPLTRTFQARAYAANQTYVSTGSRKRYGHIHTWGTTAQGVYKAGDTVQYKFYVRDQDTQRFVPAPRTGYTLKIIDPTAKVVHEVAELTLSKFGSYDGEFIAPKNGAVGWYRFELSADFDGIKHTWEPLRVLISDFTPAPFRVTNELHGTLFAPNDTVQLTTQAALHAGGPYADAPARLTARVRPRPLRPTDPQAAGFRFDVQTHTGTETIYQTEDKVDAAGMLETSFAVREAKALYGQLLVESAVRDDRGKYIASQATARYVGRDRYVGLRQEGWLLQAGQPAKLHTIVIDDQGQAVAGTDVHAVIEYRQTTASRVKGAGNAYLTHYTHAWVSAASCDLVSQQAPATCTFTPQAPGTYRMTATIADTNGRPHRTKLWGWALGAGQVLWESTPGHSLQITPEKATYAVGDTARYMVQNPYPGAKALVTVERYGVQQRWLRTFANSLEVVEVPVTADHLPGFYLSVVVMSPRVDQPLQDGHVDLGKPAFRMGYVQTEVRDNTKELVVDIQPRQAVYKPRQEATVDLHVRTRQGDTPPLELAVAVLDEAVFDLISGGRSYFDPYKGFYTLDPLDMRNYNLLLRLIGRQKFEKKGADAGGGGGPDLQLRSLFKFVSYWNPSLTPDASGKATISFSLPDNLTGWRVLALAVTPEDRMGLGEGNFKVNQPTEIRPALPNQVTTGDRFEARFTVMNRTDTTRTLTATLDATGPIRATQGVTTTIRAEPYKRYPVSLPIHTVRDGIITIRARAGDRTDADAVELPLTVRKRMALEVAATYGTTTDIRAQETFVFPTDMRTDTGHVSVVAAPSVIGGLAGAFTYLRDYPYVCWEQRLTKGVMAAHYRNLAAYLPHSLEWPESTTLPQRTLGLAANFQAPNGGMVYYRPQNTYVSPFLSAYTALAFNWLRTSGHAIPSRVESHLHDYLLTLLRRNVMPDFYSAGMSSTVRAVALAALAEHGKIHRNDILRYERHVPEMSLFGKAHYLLALSQVPNTDAQQTDVVNDVMGHANETGGKFTFGEAVDSGYERILASSLRSNCAILSAFLAYERRGGALVTDLPYKLVRTLTQSRKQRDRWENTQENMFCMNAITEFSRQYEKVTPQMTVHAFIGKTQIGTTQFHSVTDASVDFRRPIRRSDPGRKATMTLARRGRGRVYYATRLFYAPRVLPTAPTNAGMDIRREYSVERNGTWTLLRTPMEIAQGELVRVDVYLSLPGARNFVVVDDPVPGGLEPVNRDLATASDVDAAKAATRYANDAFWFRHDDWRSYSYARWSFYHQELRHHAVRFYSEYLPAGRYHLSYVAQAIAPGEFTVLPVHAEEMYDPDTFGRGVPATLRIRATTAPRKHQAER